MITLDHSIVPECVSGHKSAHFGAGGANSAGWLASYPEADPYGRYRTDKLWLIILKWSLRWVVSFDHE
jgi:hypothetical protein